MNSELSLEEILGRRNWEILYIKELNAYMSTYFTQILPYSQGKPAGEKQMQVAFVSQFSFSLSATTQINATFKLENSFDNI